ncbi:hypothetical protein SETIT_7G034800v2 [Setaria italica]|uniref:Uncharacterized protein n=1 Tax=Setaria italica TaxID=4555 RepID=A0A368RRT3_SETIT|nr:hypothetical protein SETIT_7G034800v2 [Setaria italica]
MTLCPLAMKHAEVRTAVEQESGDIAGGGRTSSSAAHRSNWLILRSTADMDTGGLIRTVPRPQKVGVFDAQVLSIQIQWCPPVLLDSGH